MKVTAVGNPLIIEMLANPDRFEESGRAYELLQDYFRGYPVETLRLLLRHENILVQRVAVWIASELGDQGCGLLHEVIPLLESPDRRSRAYALDVVIVCAIGADVGEIVHIARAMESDDNGIRMLAMQLMSNADQSQLDAGARLAGSTAFLSAAHEDALRQISNRSQTSDEIRRMMGSADPLMRRYGAIAAKRATNVLPRLLEMAAENLDENIREFATRALRIRKLAGRSL
ncbi:MAG: hypothetical protein ABL958_15445 [Bdellovibrionia bacterium]